MIRRLSVLIMSIGLSLALVLAPTATSAEDEAQPNPVEQVVKQVQDLVSPKNVQTAVDAPEPPASDDDTPPNETENPVGPDHASTRGLDTGLGPIGGTTLSLVGVNHNNATVEDDDSTHADSAALTLLGTDLFGTSASSDGDNYEESSPFGFILDAICAGSSGNICVEALYSESHATQDASTSHAHARSGILNACVGGGAGDGGELPELPAGGGIGALGQMAGQDEEPPAACQGLLGVSVAESYASSNRDRSTGQTRSFAIDGLAGACVLPGCALPLEGLVSYGFADSGTTPGTEVAERGSFLLAARSRRLHPLRGSARHLDPAGSCPVPEPG